MSMKLNVKLEKLKKVEGRISEKGKRITPNLLTGMKMALEKLRAQEQRDLTSGKYGLKTRSGRLRNSLAIAIRKRGDSVVGFMGTSLPYARAHEFGATIKPKSGKFLTIPFKGVTGRAREYTNTFFARSRNSNLILFQKTGPTTIRPLFVLKERVQLKKKKWMSRSYKGIKKDLLAILKRSIGEAVKA